MPRGRAPDASEGRHASLVQIQPDPMMVKRPRALVLRSAATAGPSPFPPFRPAHPSRNFADRGSNFVRKARPWRRGPPA